MTQQTTILCIDDDEMILEISKTYFTHLNYKVLVAENGQKGLDIYHSLSPDIVLVDLKMPIVNGFEVLKTISRESPSTPVLVFSGEGEMSDVIQALHLGAWNYLTKPLENFDIMKHAVEQALEKSHLQKENKAYQKGLERKLGTIIEHFPGYVLICDPDHRITYMNQQLLEKLGKDAHGELYHKALFGYDKLETSPFQMLPMDEGIDRQEVLNSLDGRWYDVTHLPILGQDKVIIEYQVVVLDITEQKQRLQDMQEREENLREENTRLLASLSDRFKFGNMIGKSKPMQEVYKTITSAAGTDASVIIYGESGTGKELVAQSIHDMSKRRKEPFICVNCGAIPENLIESEFFGYKKGAFSGAAKDKFGFLDIADKGTLFLDEVGDIPLNLQVKLLRAIEGGGFTPLGSTEAKSPDIRIIAATNSDLAQLVKKGKMRQDFLFRLHIIPITLPPLSERREDIPLLVEHFLNLYAPDEKKTLSDRVNSALLAHHWPGNVRELQNTIHRFLTLGKLDFLDLGTGNHKQPDSFESLEITTETLSLSSMIEVLEKRIITDRFRKNNWHQSKTADSLQVDRKTLYRKIKHYNIQKPD